MNVADLIDEEKEKVKDAKITDKDKEKEKDKLAIDLLDEKEIEQKLISGTTKQVSDEEKRKQTERQEFLKNAVRLQNLMDKISLTHSKDAADGLIVSNFNFVKSDLFA